MTSLTTTQRRALIALVILVALLAGLIGYGFGYHAMSVAALLDNAVQVMGSAIVSLAFVAGRK